MIESVGVGKEEKGGRSRSLSGAARIRSSHVREQSLTYRREHMQLPFSSKLRSLHSQGILYCSHPLSCPVLPTPRAQNRIPREDISSSFIAPTARHLLNVQPSYRIPALQSARFASTRPAPVYHRKSPAVLALVGCSKRKGCRKLSPVSTFKALSGVCFGTVNVSWEVSEDCQTSRRSVTIIDMVRGVVGLPDVNQQVCTTSCDDVYRDWRHWKNDTSVPRYAYTGAFGDIQKSAIRTRRMAEIIFASSPIESRVLTRR